MTAKKNPWFRMYSDFMFDEKIEFLAFEDQRHYVFVLCMKNSGLIDKDYTQPGMLDRVVSKRLGLYGEAFEAAKKRLIESGLIDYKFQPVAWDKRQFVSDVSTDRVQAYRERMKQTRNVSVTAQETDTDTETDTEAEKKTRAKALSQPESVSAEVWADFLSLRKDKRAKLTATALAGIQAEADKAGYTLEKALSTCCARGWQSFNADWVIGKPGQSHATAPVNKQEALEARNREVARKWAEGEQA